MAETIDIFTTIHRAVWAALTAFTPFTDLVDLRNRVDMTADDFVDFPPNTPVDAMPEAVLIQSTFTQDRFATGDAGAGRSMTLSLLLTTGKLNPVDTNKLKEASLDALIEAGLTLKIPPTNGNKVLGWSAGGEDFLTPIAVGDEAPDRQDIRSQTIMRITVFFKKAFTRHMMP